VIMAGGGGTRLWPLSRRNSPKQMLNLFSGKTLFQIALERLIGCFETDHIFVVTIADQAQRLKGITPHIPEENFLIEPTPRGTAAVVALAAAVIHKKDPLALIAVLTADHFIEDVPSFQKILLAAQEAAKHNFLVTLGIQPTFPSTGYGYIETGEIMGEYLGYEVYRAMRFEEKPDENKAIDFIKTGKYYWNSGMFIWKAAVILEEFKRFMPTLSETINQITPLIGQSPVDEQFIKLWSEIKPQTIDYGIMEKSERVLVIPSHNLGWNDVGSWDSLFDVIPADENGNIILNAQSVALDTRNSIIFSDSKEKLIVTLGVQNMIIVNTVDSILICPRGESQKIKQLVDYLKENHFTPFL
jgi:mannose-1-phosphate guanylyltransferase